MDIDPQRLLLPAVVAIAASATVCAAVLARFIRREPIVPYQPRRPVPWRWPELLIVMVAALAIGQYVNWATPAWSGPSPPAAEPTTEAEDLAATHPLIVLLMVDRRASVLLLICVAAIVVAPIVEEFYFRLLLQGWLEAIGRRRRRQNEALRLLLPGTMPVLTSAVLFGSIHYRLVPPPTDAAVLVRLFATSTVARVLTFGVAVWVLRRLSGATAADLGFVPGKLLGDVGLGLAAFAVIGAPLYAVQLVLSRVLPNSPLVDPITLTLFAVVLGALYYRTHRIVPSIVLHMGLNATSVAMALWFLRV